MPNREFLESYPLYKKFNYAVPAQLKQIPKPSVHMYCQVCKSEQTFNMSNEYFEGIHPATSPAGLVAKPIYVCSGCKRFARFFLLKFDDESNYVMKVGQQPPWEIDMDKELEKSLGDYKSLYKRGLTCESQGYGIGAFAYFRGIVEAIIDELLYSVADLIAESEKEKYIAAVEDAKKTTVAKEKIALVKDLLPTSLRPDGMNPLGILHDTLSKGLHGRSDEDCLEDAGHLKDILVYLINQIIRSKAESKKFTESMRKLLDKKT